MSRKSFENYGQLATRTQDWTALAGLYSIQKSEQRNIVRDILTKLDLRSDHSLLDIGCNSGNLTIPLSFMVASTTGIDHPSCLRVLRERFPAGIELVSGNFFEVQLSQSFDRIVCYGVLNYLRDTSEVHEFMDKAVGLLAGGGKALFGDVPNVSAKQRFLQSAEGIEFTGRWEQLRKQAPEDDQTLSVDPDPDIVQFDDTLLLSIIGRYRKKGFHGYILPQPPNLPFGRTREDILIVRPR
jgi:2-polyprenyl-3-methyl-5-hydroxy-6-metoxy-1,4-benzoquinol methylase